MPIRKDKLVEILRDKEFRDHFAEDQIYELLTLQIRQLRERNRWTQEDLGAKAGMAQSAIARVENPNYTSSKIATLSKLARVFDVALIVRFAPFGELVDWLSTLSPRSFLPASFEQELPSLEHGVILARVSGQPQLWRADWNIVSFDTWKADAEPQPSSVGEPIGSARQERIHATA
jgi:transcriptional regulator with XRE-family HTH domain